MLTAQLSTAEKVKINNSSPVPLIKNNTVPTSILTSERPVSNPFMLCVDRCHTCHAPKYHSVSVPFCIPFRSFRISLYNTLLIYNIRTTVVLSRSTSVRIFTRGFAHAQL